MGGGQALTIVANHPETFASVASLSGAARSFDVEKFKRPMRLFWIGCGTRDRLFEGSNKIHEQLTDKQKKDIEFLYISIDADTNNWKKAVTELDLIGTQFFSPGNWKSKACSYFQIGSIPRYMIMNKKGEIVDVNAPRPDNPQLMELLIKLSEEK